MSEKWTADRISEQGGRTAVVTGANSGIGLVVARELARRGAHVVMACRDMAKGEAAAERIRSAGVPGARLELSELDLASLESTRAFAERLRSAHDGVDLLVNNAGVMATRRRRTADGFELQLGTNHLGHFALTGLLLGAMEGREDARVVTVASVAHRTGRVNFDDLQGERRYFRWFAYSQSKLANLLFATELDRRLRAAGSTVASVACHPGYTATNLGSSAPLADRLAMGVAVLVAAQSAEMGALPILFAATEPSVEGGAYIGPDGFRELRGHPRFTSPANHALNEEAALRLWAVSEDLTGVGFGLRARAAA